MQNDALLKKQITLIASELKLRESVIEKDFYVTQVINIVNAVTHNFYDLVFQGDTSLAKAHRIIERMSEDCDFRIRFKNPAVKLSKESKRKTLRQFRHEIIAALRTHDFVINDNEVRVRNEGQFMGIRARYPSVFPTLPELKPFLAVEFFLSDVKVAPQIKPVTTLVKQILGNEINHAEFPVNSVAVIETAAGK